jgi:hypothetical protein
MDTTKAFSDIAAIADHKTKTDKYKALLDQFLSQNAVKELKAFVDHSILFIYCRKKKQFFENWMFSLTFS